MKLTWFGHSAFALEIGDNKIMIDPFLSGNPTFESSGKSWEEVAKGTTHVALTHGHSDHIGNTVDICRETGAMLVANFEVCNYLTSQGVDGDKINPGNHGGTVDCGGFTVTFVNAIHSSADIVDGKLIYLGNPCGLVFHAPNEKTLYHMGDTDIFGDMALIHELHRPEIGIVPIGDRFTMGGAVAALACRRFFDFEAIIPCHYGTFGIIDADETKFVEAMEEEAEKVKAPGVGEALTL